MSGLINLSRVFYQIIRRTQQKRVLLTQNRCIAAMSSLKRDQAMGLHGSKNKAKNPQNSQPDSQQKVNYVTRQKVAEKEAMSAKEWSAEKERFLKMPIEEKRNKYYKCGKNYTEVHKVKFWPQYAQENSLDHMGPNPDVNDTLNGKISIWKGDLTTLEADVIVNAANRTLLGGGGVDGAIHRAAGKMLLKECESLNGCETGDAKISGGYKLPARYIIHTVGPIGEDRIKLSSCYKSCLNLAVKHDCRTIAFPCISTGIYGYNVSKATPVVMATVKEWLSEEKHREKIDRIIFCVFLKKDISVYEENLQKYFPVSPETKSKDCNGQDDIKSKEVKETSRSANKTEEPSGEDDSQSMDIKDNVDITSKNTVNPVLAPDAKKIRKDEEPMEDSNTCEQTVEVEKKDKSMQEDEGKLAWCLAPLHETSV